MDLELVSFKLCPFVQRSVITLLYKKAPFRTTFINLNEPPEWFRDISPLGKVPLLKVDGEVLFESAIINEFIDEVTPGLLMPADPLLRAKNRAWIEFGSNCLGQMFTAISGKEAQAHEDACSDLNRSLAFLEKMMGEGPYFNGADFSLVDTAYAPLFQRLMFLNRFKPVVDWDALPKLRAWSDNLLAMAVIRESLAEGFDEIYPKVLKGMGGHYAGFVG